jgi:hypothetical protein
VARSIEYTTLLRASQSRSAPKRFFGSAWPARS